MTSKPPVPPSSRDPNRSIAESNAEGILQHAVDQLVIERDELRAEVERQRWIINTATDEQVRLRAEVERLRALNQHQVTLVEQARAERDESDAEVGRLRAQRDEAIARLTTIQGELDELQIKNERMRADNDELQIRLGRDHPILGRPMEC